MSCAANRIVFHNKIGKLIFCSKDSFNSEKLIFLNKDISKHFVRTIGNLSIGLNKDNDVELFIKKIDLPAIKYTNHNKFINPESKFKTFKGSIKIPIPIRNPKFGVFDIETFIDIGSDGEEYSRVFALGFFSYMGASQPSIYYLSDYFDNNVTKESSDKLVLKCIEDMLNPSFIIIYSMHIILVDLMLFFYIKYYWIIILP